MKPTCIREQHIEVNLFSRPGLVRHRTVVFDMHWNDNPGMNEFELADYFKSLKNQDPHDSEADRYAGANYCIGPTAAIEIIPPGEVSYTAGADGIKSFYTSEAKRIFGESFTRYWSESYQKYGDKYYALSPNFLTVSMELVHPDDSGWFEPETLRHAALVVAWLSCLYPGAIPLRHYDITRKLCPKRWVDFPVEWVQFKKKVQAFNGFVE